MPQFQSSTGQYWNADPNQDSGFNPVVTSFSQGGIKNATATATQRVVLWDWRRKVDTGNNYAIYSFNPLTGSYIGKTMNLSFPTPVPRSFLNPDLIDKVYIKTTFRLVYDDIPIGIPGGISMPAYIAVRFWINGYDYLASDNTGQYYTSIPANFPPFNTANNNGWKIGKDDAFVSVDSTMPANITFGPFEVSNSNETIFKNSGSGFYDPITGYTFKDLLVRDGLLMIFGAVYFDFGTLGGNPGFSQLSVYLDVTNDLEIIRK